MGKRLRRVLRVVICIIIAALFIQPSTNAATTDLKSVAMASSRWPQPYQIPVCWQTSGYSTEKLWVRDAIKKSWEANSSAQFIEWGSCRQDSPGIHIKIADDWPHVKRLGRYLDRVSEGMVLNFTFETWTPWCQSAREQCIRWVAVHEFGHALGLTHEHNRHDADAQCRRERQGSDGDILLTSYDPDSIMNYCREGISDRLSPKDIEGVSSLYGASPIYPNPGGRYYIQPAHGLTCLAVQGAAKGDNAKIIQNKCHDDPHFQFEFVSVGQDYYQIKAAHSGRCWAVQKALKGDNVNVIQNKCFDYEHFEFGLAPFGGAFFQIMPKHSGLCVAIQRAKMRDNADLIQNKCYDFGHFIFKITPSF